MYSQVFFNVFNVHIRTSALCDSTIPIAAENKLVYKKSTVFNQSLNKMLSYRRETALQGAKILKLAANLLCYNITGHTVTITVITPVCENKSSTVCALSNLQY